MTEKNEGVEHSQAIPIVRLVGVEKRFGGVSAVAGVDLVIQQGERHAIIGPNGAGKTTLFNLVSGKFPVTSGKVELFGRDVTNMPLWRRARHGVGRTYQQSDLLEGLTVIENLCLAALGVVPRRFYLRSLSIGDPESMAKALELSDVVGLFARRETKVCDLSHGERRQTEIGMALASEPRLVLFDEPAAGLSQAEKPLLMDLLMSLDRRITMMLIEHDMEIAMHVAERITVMHEGLVVVQGTPKAIEADSVVQDIYLGKRDLP